MSVTRHMRKVDVGLAPEDAAHGVGDVVGVEAGGGHLVEQRLEGVVVVRVDQHHVDRRLGQRLRRRQAAEPGPDHDHPMTIGSCRRPYRRQPFTNASATSSTPLSSTPTKPPTDGGLIW